MPDPLDPKLDSFARRLLAIGQPPLAVSHEPTVTPPQQSRPQPPLAVSHVQQTRDPLIAATLGARGIGPSEVGERYVPPTMAEAITRPNPLGAVAENVGSYALGARRPPTVAAADPFGIGAWEKGAGPMPMFLGTTEPIDPAGPGLYSRVDRIAEQLSEKGVHPNKLASLLKSGASQEEVAYRQLPEFLAAKGNQPVTRAELQAHLAEHPAPFPKTVTLGGPNPARPTALPEGYSIQPVQQESRFGIRRFTLQGPDGTGQILHADNPEDALGEALTRLHPTVMPTLPTKYQSYSLPGGEQYREHLLTLPDPVAIKRTDLQARMEAKLAEIKQLSSVSPGTLTPEEYHASPQYRQLGQIIYEHNALNEELRALPRSPTGYQSSHFDEPNILTHVRTTERHLPGTPPPEMPVVAPKTGEDLAREGWTVRVDREEPYSGRRQMTLLNPQGEWSGSRGMTPLTPEEYLHAHAAEQNVQAERAAGEVPPGPRGRFIEEIQSDWHQAGKRSGYATPLDPAAQARLAQLPQEIASAQRMVSGHNARLKETSNAYLELLQSSTRQHLPPEYQHLTSFGDATRLGDREVAVWRAAREEAQHRTPALGELRRAENEAQQHLTRAVNRHSALQEEHGQLLKPKGVPDAPFKSSWPDLALKQQLLDVARDPHANWLGFTSGKTQAERYDLSKQVSRLTFEPEEAGDYSLGSLVAHDLHGNEVLRENRLEPHELDAHIGKEPADALRREIASHAHDAEQWSVAQDPETGYWHVVDPNGEYVGGDHALTEQGAERARQQIVREQSEQSWPHIAGLDLQVGGEGMRHFYDQLLPARLQKLLKPFGGTVERGAVPTEMKTMDVDVPAFSVRDQHGHMRGVWENRADAEAYLANPPDFIDPTRSTIVPATTVRTQQVPVEAASWIAHLSPELKRKILRQGFPLLTLPLALRQAIAASGSQVGEPPPVTLAPSHARTPSP